MIKQTGKRPRLISGGQTGVDQGALEAALENGWPCGGTCPRGRLDENGRIPARYPLTEATSSEWSVRTRINVDNADATLILVRRLPLTGGTLLTAQYAEDQDKPLFVATEPWDQSAIGHWLAMHDPDVLNVAGPRESGAPGIGRAAQAFVSRLLERIGG